MSFSKTITTLGAAIDQEWKRRSKSLPTWMSWYTVRSGLTCTIRAMKFFLVPRSCNLTCRLCGPIKARLEKFGTTRCHIITHTGKSKEKPPLSRSSSQSHRITTNGDQRTTGRTRKPEKSHDWKFLFTSLTSFNDARLIQEDSGDHCFWSQLNLGMMADSCIFSRTRNSDI